MKKIIISIFIILLLPFNTYAHVDHYADINQLKYNIYRNNNLIGTHEYNFSRKDGNLEVSSNGSLEVYLLGLKVYFLKTVSLEKFDKNGQLIEFSSQTDQNGKAKQVNLTYDQKKDLFLLDASSNKGELDKNLLPSTWWNHKLLTLEAQFSATSGRKIDQKVTFLGKEKITIQNKEFDALKFNISSTDETLPDDKKLDVDIWYEDKSFLWIKSSFQELGNWEYRLEFID